MTKFEFKPEDFSKYAVNEMPDCVPYGFCQAMAKLANAKIAPLLARLNELESMIENAPVVYGTRTENGFHTIGNTHKARLVCIEKIDLKEVAIDRIEDLLEKLEEIR